MIQIPVHLLERIKSYIETLDGDKKNDAEKAHLLNQLNDYIPASNSHIDSSQYKKPEVPPAIALNGNFNSESNSVNAFINFAHWIGSLKTLKRTGWLIEGLSSEQSESVAEHSYRMAMLLFATPPSYFGADSFSLDTAIKMCLVHDAAEAIVGDIPPLANISRSEKLAQEKTAMQFLDGLISNPEDSTEFYKIWDRYERRECPESKLVKDLDRIELLLQTYEYKLSHPTIDCDGFFQNTLPHLENPFIKQCAEKLNESRLKILNKSN